MGTLPKLGRVTPIETWNLKYDFETSHKEKVKVKSTLLINFIQK